VLAYSKLDGCIVWNAHNTVLGKEALLIYIVTVWVSTNCNKFTHVGGNVTVELLWLLVILNWLTDDSTAAAVIKKKELVGPKSLRSRLPQSVRDEAVDVSVVKEFLTLPARRAVQQKVAKLKKEPWTCAVCENCVDDVRCIACDQCLQWFHYHCQSISQTPRNETYFCRSCRRN